MSLNEWVFSDAEPHQTADGRHTFYRVHGQIPPRDIGYGLMSVNSFGEMTIPVTGEGPTAEDALADAMRKAARQDEEHAQRRWEIGAALLRGGITFRP